MISISFAPLVYKNSKVLILGTMPGIESLKKQQYYAHNRNAFWPLIFRTFEKELSFDYETRIGLLKKNGIAIWDTLEYCYREGSLDSNIKNAKPNKISKLLSDYQSIKTIIFNGKEAEKYYKKFHQSFNGIAYHCMPSTSPANARMNFKQKLEAWSVILLNSI